MGWAVFSRADRETARALLELLDDTEPRGEVNGMDEHTSVVPAGFVKDYTAEDVRSVLIQALLVSEVTPASGPDDEQQREVEGR